LDISITVYNLYYNTTYMGIHHI